MKELNFSELQNLEGGDVIEGICVGLSVGGSIWAGAAFLVKSIVLPPPVAAGMIVAGIACGVYTAVKHERS